MATVEVRDGRPVAVHTGGEELRRHAAVLRRLAGPGVPAVFDLEDDGTRVRLVTEVAPPVPAADLVAAAPDVAAVLARAHDAGVVHGPLREEHVLGAPGEVLVVGWESAGPGAPSTDVAELGRLLERHVGGDARLGAAVARALAPDPPPMAAFADALRAARHPDPARRPLPVAVLAGLAVALALVAVGLVVDGRRTAPEPAVAAGRIRTEPTSTTTSSLAPRPRIAVQGNVVERDGERWTVGRPGDVVVVGDWDCDGDATPAVLRPVTGEVWVFSRWTPAGVSAAGRAVGTVPGAATAHARHAGSCDRLEVTTAEGQSTTVG